MWSTRCHPPHHFFSASSTKLRTSADAAKRHSIVPMSRQQEAKKPPTPHAASWIFFLLLLRRHMPVVPIDTLSPLYHRALYVRFSVSINQPFFFNAYFHTSTKAHNICFLLASRSDVCVKGFTGHSFNVGILLKTQGASQAKRQNDEWRMCHNNVHRQHAGEIAPWLCQHATMVPIVCHLLRHRGIDACCHADQKGIHVVRRRIGNWRLANFAIAQTGVVRPSDRAEATALSASEAQRSRKRRLWHAHRRSATKTWNTFVTTAARWLATATKCRASNCPSNWKCERWQCFISFIGRFFVLFFFSIVCYLNAVSIIPKKRRAKRRRFMPKCWRDMKQWEHSKKLFFFFFLTNFFQTSNSCV